eukprot:3311565-Lingulodinium_polyedra.AAC.1
MRWKRHAAGAGCGCEPRTSGTTTTTSVVPLRGLTTIGNGSTDSGSYERPRTTPTGCLGMKRANGDIRTTIGSTRRSTSDELRVTAGASKPGGSRCCSATL